MKRFKDIGFRVLGFTVDVNATEDDIKRFNDFFGEMELEVGQIHLDAGCMIHPDKNIENEYRKNIIKALEIGGKIGASALQVSVGSMHPENVWIPHQENHTQKALDTLIKNAKEIAPYAEDNRCMISPETNQWTIVNSIERMKEYVDRIDSPYMKITIDFVNHMTSHRIFESGRFVQYAVATLGERIGLFHVKDVTITEGMLNVVHIDEAEMGTGIMDLETVIKVSTQLEPWKLFELEHINDVEMVKQAYDHIQGIADRIGHTWTDPNCSRERWQKGLCK